MQRSSVAGLPYNFQVLFVWLDYYGRGKNSICFGAIARAWRQVVVACNLLGIESADQLSRDPLAGGLAENFAITEYMKSRWNRGRDARIHFCRDRHGSEVDLLISKGNKLVPVEIKSASTFTASHIKGIRKFSSLAGDRVAERYLVFNGDDRGTVEGVEMLGFEDMAKLG